MSLLSRLGPYRLDPEVWSTSRSKSKGVSKEIFGFMDEVFLEK